MLIAERLADFAFDLKYEDLPASIVEAAQRHLFDSVACALGASNVEPVRALVGLALANGGRPDATILGTDSKIPVTAAALVGGTMVRYLDANDIFAPGEGGGGHYSDAIPALIALAEMQGASGKELLTCIVAVYELQFAAGRAFSFGRRGFHSISQMSWALPVVTTRMLGANREAAVHAMGLAGATGLVLNTWLRPSETIPSIKGVASGLAAERAVEAAILAASGITASRDALEYISSRLQASDEASPDLNGVDGLGNCETMLVELSRCWRDG